MLLAVKVDSLGTLTPAAMPRFLEIVIPDAIANPMRELRESELCSQTPRSVLPLVEPFPMKHENGAAHR
jgi:hypothetical protein